ncbi:MAG: glycosyltransferase family 4 protein [Ruminococcaceae bacterium]|nr:glycosyltransferase family 4 protein [Oscillospiraceae bacterium]
MKILMVNKFLYQKGGAETYTIKLGEILKRNGHEVEYFGLQNDKNTLFNSVDAYVTDADFTKGIKANLTAPFRIIYNVEARRKIRKVLDSFAPDIVHLNNIHFHLTPSIILEIEKYRKETLSDVKIIYTAHDYQLICPSHGLFDSDINVCEKCLCGNYTHCLKTKCVKNSRAKSLLATLDAYYWKHSKAYSYVDTIVCCSEFLKSKLDTQDRFKKKTVALHNFVDKVDVEFVEKKDYVLQFGHLSKDKGTDTLLEVAKSMSDTQFVFAGYGESEKNIEKVENATYVGFKTGDELKSLIQKAKVSVYPSQWYENCPFSVIESQMYLTPVVGSRMGGIPELIREGETGELFESGNAKDLENKIKMITQSDARYAQYVDNCRTLDIETEDTYFEKIMKIYSGEFV